MASRDPFLQAFRDVQANSDAVKAQPERIRRMRGESLERFAEIGFPTTRHEEWKYTDLSPLAAIPCTPAFGYRKNGIGDADVAYWNFDHPAGWNVLVFVDGHWAPELSRTSSLAPGMIAGSIAKLLATRGPAATVIESQLGRLVAADAGAPSLADLNTAFLEDGAFVHVPAGLEASCPVTIVHVATSRPFGRVTHPRTLIVVEPGARATVVERYVSLAGAEAMSFADAVSEIVVGDGAMVDHYRLEKDEEHAYHVGYTRSEIGRNARLETHCMTVGAHFVRNNTHALLNAPGGEVIVNGLYLCTDGQHVDNHTAIDHARPHGTSHELYKGILDGRSRAVFNGKIFVRQDAQKTDSKQTNRNLLLSDASIVDTKPQLEIFADDVKCTHGATVGQLDEEQIFYLESRGISANAARDILIYGFARDVLEKIHCVPLTAQLDAMLMQRLRDRHARASS